MILQAAKTDGYLCETLGSAATVAARFQDLSGLAVVAGASILQVLLAQANEDGPLSQACASAAASVLGQSLIAIRGNRTLAMAGGARGTRSIERGEGELEWMLSLEAGMDKVHPLPDRLDFQLSLPLHPQPRCSGFLCPAYIFLHYRHPCFRS